MAAPVGARGLDRDIVSGQAPQSVALQAAHAVLRDSAGREITRVALIGGKFRFPEVAQGEYTVTLTDRAGARLATSQRARVAGAFVNVTFADSVAQSTTGWQTTTARVTVAADAVGVPGANCGPAQPCRYDGEKVKTGERPKSCTR